MKPIFILPLFIFVFSNGYSQDIIITNGEHRFPAWIVVEDPTTITFIVPDDPDSIVRKLDKDLISIIIYATVKLSENEIDEFTGDLKRSTKYTTIARSGKESLEASMKRINDLYILQMASTRYGINECLVEYSSRALFMLDNEEIIEFYQVSGTSCGEKVSGKFLFGNKEMVDRLTDAEYLIVQDNLLKKLTQHSWIKLRVYYSDGYIDYQPSGKNSGMFYREQLKALDRPVTGIPARRITGRNDHEFIELFFPHDR
jgi:hypothetical protein